MYYFVQKVSYSYQLIATLVLCFVPNVIPPPQTLWQKLSLKV